MNFHSAVNPQDVFVLYSTGLPAMPCTRRKAKRLLQKRRAKIWQYNPFTIILLDRETGVNQEVEVKIDPGSKTTGIAVVSNDSILFAANLEHRGQKIVAALIERAQHRASRRNRKVRYRAARFDNRKNRVGKLPTSVQSRVDHVANIVRKLQKICPISSIACETTKFDTQKMQDAKISGVQYQQGELQGYEVREYLLEKYHRSCVYCDAKNVPLQIEHVVAKSNGGSNRISNLVISCEPCNQKKGSLDVRDFVKNATRLAKILANLKTPLRDAAAMNAIRIKIGNTLEKFGLPISFANGALTKFNRTQLHYPKDHWIDAACVGESGSTVRLSTRYKPLKIKAIGRGNRQMMRTNKFGFPRNEAAKSSRRNFGFSTGDLVIATISRGQSAGTHIARICSAGKRRIDIAVREKIVGATPKNLVILQRFDGYAYSR